MSFQTLATFVLAGDPTDAGLLRALYLLADAESDEDQRRTALTGLVKNRHLDADLVTRIARDRDPKVRAEFWRIASTHEDEETGQTRFGQNPYGDVELAGQLLAGEKLARVRAEAIRSGTLDVEIIRAVCTPMRVELAKALLHSLTGPADLLVEALRIVWRPGATQTAEQRWSSLLAARGNREVAEAVIGDELLPPQVWLAAATCSELDEEEAVTALKYAVDWFRNCPRHDLGWQRCDTADRKSVLNWVGELAERVVGIEESTAAAFKSATLLFLREQETVYRRKFLAVRDGEVTVSAVQRMSSAALVQVIDRMPGGAFDDADLVPILLTSRNADEAVVEALGRRGVGVGEEELDALVVQAMEHRFRSGAPGSSLKAGRPPEWVRFRPRLMVRWIANMPSTGVGDVLAKYRSDYPGSVSQLVDEALTLFAAGEFHRDRLITMVTKLDMTRDQLALLPAEEIISLASLGRADAVDPDQLERVRGLVAEALALVKSPDETLTMRRALVFNEMVGTGVTLADVMFAVRAVYPDSGDPAA